jgi:hypothetical protein
MRGVRIIMIVAAMLLLFGSAEAKTPYQIGYSDGCRTAKGVFTKRVKMFNRNVNYRNGWYAGKRACAKKANPWNSYARGYSDGCSSARGVWRKNVRAYRLYRAYRNGWNAGKRACAKNKPILWNSYARGYSDGCSSARGVWRKNVRAYRLFAAYRNGWNAGKRACAKKANPWNSYAVGYRDGCSSARGIWRKNVWAYRRFAAYRNGWNAGKRACARKVTLWNSYAKGYRDGCSSARGVWRKNIRAYRLYRAYRTGWNQGRRVCAIPRFKPMVATGAVAAGATAVAVAGSDVIVQTPNEGKTETAAPDLEALINAAKDYVLQNYVHKPLPKELALQVQTVKINGKYGMIEAIPVFADQSEIGSEYIEDLLFQLCLKKDDQGQWQVVYDLSRSDVPSAEELQHIKAEFPKDFPTKLLPDFWKKLFETPAGAPLETGAGTMEGANPQSPTPPAPQSESVPAQP